MVILFDQYNLPEDIFKVIFATEQQEIVAKMLLNYMWERGGEIGKTEMSVFATHLHEGSAAGARGPLWAARLPAQSGIAHRFAELCHGYRARRRRPGKPTG